MMSVLSQSLSVSLAASIIAAGGGCGSGQKGTQPGNRNSPPIATQPLNRPAGVNQSIQVVTAVLSLGAVPYDNSTLPLVSPDGAYVATQTGVAPTWETTLAEYEAEIPVATRIEVYALDWREKIKPEERQPPTLLTSLSEPVMLGRSCDAEGFLVESPREDGSRWIGKADWRTGEITWLVNDEQVNAFAALGPGGRLAWSRRPVDAPYFELVVRNGGGGEWSYRTESEDWLMPTWSGRGDGMFVMQLRGEALEMRYAQASSQAAFRQSMQRIVLASEAAKLFTAYQTVVGQSGALPRNAPAREQIVFYHPGLMRMALWRPLAESDRQRTQLNARSLAALVDEEDFAFVATGNSLLRQNLRKPSERIELVGGSHVPRQISSADWPFLLLSPGEGVVGITAMKLLPREQAIISTR